MQTQISPQSSVSAELRRDVDVIIARHDNNRDRAKAVCFSLLFEHGVVPKPAFVQTLLSLPGKTANHSTVKGGVQDFWDEVRKKMHVSLPTMDLPEDLVRRFGDVVEAFWAESKQAGLVVAREELSELREAAARLVQTANQERDSAMEQQSRTIEALHVAQGALQSMTEDVNGYKEQVAALNARIATMAAALAKEQSSVEQMALQLQSQEQNHAKAVATLREAVAVEQAAKEALSASLTGEINFAKQQIEAARQGEREAKSKLAACEARLEKQQAERVQLERQVAVMAHQIDSVEMREKALKEGLLAATAKADGLRMEVHHGATEIHRLNDIVERLSLEAIEVARALAFSKIPELANSADVELFVELDVTGRPVYRVTKSGIEVVAKTRSLDTVASKMVS